MGSGSFFGLWAVKKLQLDPFTSITLETLLMLPWRFGIWRSWTALRQSFWRLSPPWTLCLAGTGVVTASPALFYFRTALICCRWNVLGFFQYIGPTIGFLLGVFYFRNRSAAYNCSAFSLFGSPCCCLLCRIVLLFFRANNRQIRPN